MTTRAAPCVVLVGAFLLRVVQASVPNGGTSVIDSLNAMISGGSQGPYTGGKGVLVRAIYDGLNDGPNLGVPATFWSNDIYAVSQMYPDRVDLDEPGVTDIFSYASVGFVIGGSMYNLFYDFDNIQTSTWGWGVFYGHDSNSVDIRCRYLSSYNGYDCPGGWIPWGGTWSDDSTKLGTGGYPVGNPFANANWGGGAGCHLDWVSHTIDQLNAFDANNNNLVEDPDCQCNYVFNSNWADWVSLFATANNQMSSHSLHADQGICWVSNIFDMISIQNNLFWGHVAGEWDTSGSVFSGTKAREYMGWNEIPVDRVTVGDPSNWDAFLIKLPADICDNGDHGGSDHIGCLSHTKRVRLEKKIVYYNDHGALLFGLDHASERPGSYAVVAREWQDDSGNWFRWFFCQNWDSPSDKYHMVWLEESASNQYGACYLTES